MVVPPCVVWCSKGRCKTGKRSGIAIGVVVITVAFVVLKGKPKVRHALTVEHVFPLGLEVFIS